MAAGKSGADRPARAEVADFLSSLLAVGPLCADSIQQEAVAARHLKAGVPIRKDKTFRLAKQEFGISQKTGTVYRAGGAWAARQWLWLLPG